MKKASQKRIGRAALAGATLLGLTAAGLAFAAPASADDRTVTGPLAAIGTSTTYYAMGDNAGTIAKSYYTDASWAAADKSALSQWTYPAPGATGPIVSPLGKCLEAPSLNFAVAAAQKQPVTAVTCTGGTLQTWTAVENSDGVVQLRLASQLHWGIGVQNPSPGIVLGQDMDMSSNSAYPVYSNFAPGMTAGTLSQLDRALTSPLPGAGITPDTVFTGTGAVGDVVVVTDTAGTVLGSAEVGEDGTWSLTLNPAPVNGPVDLTVVMSGDDGALETVADGTYTMTGSEEPNAYTGPTSGTITPDTVFTGTGAKGETVTITDDQGKVLGTTVIGDDGQWSLTLEPAPINGDLNLTVKIGDETVANPSVTMTGSDEAPGYTGPADGATITPDTEFTGTGGKGDTVTITDKDGNVLGETTVGDDGQWSLTLDPAPKNGDVNLIVTVGDTKVADTNLVMTGSDEERALTSPTSGSTIRPDTKFTGTGNIGDTITITDKDGNVLGSVEVGSDGQWSTTLSPVPNNGPVDLVIEATGKDNKTETLASNTYEMTDSTNAFEVLTPDLSTDNGSITNGTVFTGKGEPGTTIVITDKDGNTVGQAEVDTEGNWSAPVTGLPQGPNNLEITYTAPGADPVSIDLGAIVVVSEDEATPLMDPAIAGGAALALLAAAGSVLLIRRRTSTN